jgi:flotillin
LAGKIAAPLSSIDKLTVVDTGKGEGAARVSNYVTELMATAPDMLKSVSGIELDRLIQGLTKGKIVAAPPAVEVASAKSGVAVKAPEPVALETAASKETEQDGK